MKENTDRYLKAFDHGGVPILVYTVVDDILKDPKLSDTKIARNPEGSIRELIKCLLNITHGEIEYILNGSHLRHSLRPPVEKFSAKQLEAANQEFQYSQNLQPSTQPTSFSSSSTNESEFDKENIDSDLEAEPEYSDGYSEHDETGYLGRQDWQLVRVTNSRVFQGKVRFRCLFQSGGDIIANWKFPAYFENSNPPYQSILDFQKQFPKKPKHGKMDCWGLLKAEETQNIVYANWFLDVNPCFMYGNPSSKVLSHLLERMRFYCKRLPSSHERYQEWREFVKRVDFPKYGLKHMGWKESDWRAGKNRHITKKDGSFNKDRAENWEKTLFQIMESEIATISEDAQDLPHPLPLTEVGFTGKTQDIEKAHGNHSGTSAALTFLECVSLAEYGGRYRWIYQPFVTCLDEGDGQLLEEFFSTALQSYTWLGGVNPYVPGKSIEHDRHLTIEQSNTHYSLVDYENFKANIQDSSQKLDLLIHFRDREETLKARKELEEARSYLKTVNERHNTLSGVRRREQQDRLRNSIEALNQLTAVQQDLTAAEETLSIVNQIEDLYLEYDKKHRK